MEDQHRKEMDRPVGMFWQKLAEPVEESVKDQVTPLLSAFVSGFRGFTRLMEACESELLRIEETLGEDQTRDREATATFRQEIQELKALITKPRSLFSLLIQERMRGVATALVHTVPDEE